MPPSQEEIHRRLLSPGERLGWAFRDARRSWRPWSHPLPKLNHLMVVATVGIGLYALTVWRIVTSIPEGRQGSVFLAWLILVVPIVGLALYHHLLERRHVAYLAAEMVRVSALDEWGAVTPARGTRRIDLFGGDREGWASFLTTFGGSMLAEELPVTVLDLSQDGASLELAQIGRSVGVETRVEMLPDHLESSLLLHGLTPDEVRDILVEAIHGDSPEPSRDERMIDDRILGSLCRALAPEPTLARLHHALRRLLGEPDPGPGTLAREDLERVDHLFTPEYISRSHDRLQRLEAYLANLAEFTQRSIVETPAAAKLTILAVTARGGQAATELLTDLLGQWLLRSLKRLKPPTSKRTIVVVAAENLKPRHLDQLAWLCDGLDFRLLLMFRRLREEEFLHLGGGQAAVFMRLGNAAEASRAADFIGRGHRFELAQVTRAYEETETRRSGPVDKAVDRMSPWERRWGEAWGRSVSRSWSHAETRERVYEFHVEPCQLQALGPSAFLLVQHPPDRKPQITAGDCDPDILSLPRVSVRPLPAEIAKPALPAP